MKNFSLIKFIFALIFALVLSKLAESSDTRKALKLQVKTEEIIMPK